jgi:hypothetical protein
LPEAEFAYNNSWQASINTTPFRLTYGPDPIIPFQQVLNANIPIAEIFARKMKNDLDRARKFLVAAQDRQKYYADLRRREISLGVGQKVLLSTKNLQMHGTAKLLPRYIGPFTISEQISPVAFRLVLPAHYKIHNVFHASLLKAYKDSGTVQPPPPELIDGEEEYEVEDIIDHRDRRGCKTEYLVRWVGYGPGHDSWEPVDHLVHAQEKLQNYLDSYGSGRVTTQRQRKRA